MKRINQHFPNRGNIIEVRRVNSLTDEYEKTPLSPYLAGLPCSQCKNDSLCYNKMCATKINCKKQDLNCDCNLKCQNCGTLNKASCKCNCAFGWDSPDCSRPCTNSNKNCGKTLTSFSCTSEDVRSRHCRQMCNQCRNLSLDYPLPFFHPLVTGEKTGKLSNLCCGGRRCPIGYILDATYCECKLFCPGPKCSSSEITLSTSSLIAIVCYLTFQNVWTTYHR